MNQSARSAGVRRRRASAGVNCSSTCPTKSHKTYGECLRAKNLQLSPHVNDQYSTRQTAWDSELDHYKKAVDDGLDPVSTKRKAVDAAIREAENG